MERARRTGDAIERIADYIQFDRAPRHTQPGLPRVVIATLVSIVGSLGIDALLVVLGTRLFPATVGYVHFRFSDYAKLTVIGVIVACVGWPIVTRLTLAPRWLFLRLAVAVTLVLWLPDLYILMKGQPGDAVLVLVFMHLAIALVTYNALVRIAPVVARQESLEELLAPLPPAAVITAPADEVAASGVEPAERDGQRPVEATITPLTAAERALTEHVIGRT